jgi:hypothetical protein
LLGLALSRRRLLLLRLVTRWSLRVLLLLLLMPRLPSGRGLSFGGGIASLRALLLDLLLLLGCQPRRSTGRRWGLSVPLGSRGGRLLRSRLLLLMLLLPLPRRCHRPSPLMMLLLPRHRMPGRRDIPCLLLLPLRRRLTLILMLRLRRTLLERLPGRGTTIPHADPRRRRSAYSVLGRGIRRRSVAASVVRRWPLAGPAVRMFQHRRSAVVVVLDPLLRGERRRMPIRHAVVEGRGRLVHDVATITNDVDIYTHTYIHGVAIPLPRCDSNRIRRIDVRRCHRGVEVRSAG